MANAKKIIMSVNQKHEFQLEHLQAFLYCQGRSKTVTQEDESSLAALATRAASIFSGAAEVYF